MNQASAENTFQPQGSNPGLQSLFYGLQKATLGTSLAPEASRRLRRPGLASPFTTVFSGRQNTTLGTSLAPDASWRLAHPPGAASPFTEMFSTLQKATLGTSFQIIFYRLQKARLVASLFTEMFSMGFRAPEASRQNTLAGHGFPLHRDGFYGLQKVMLGSRLAPEASRRLAQPPHVSSNAPRHPSAPLTDAFLWA